MKLLIIYNSILIYVSFYCFVFFFRVKQERINALRIQYDAFLQEDKLRKDRNCFILERLDKMCLTSAAVPLQNRRNILYSNRQLEIRNPSDKQIGHFVDYNTQLTRQIIPEFPKEMVDESFMIQEISKKYILIPKIMTTPLPNDIPSIKSVANDSSEWTQKYEILNQLKKNELDTKVQGYGKDDYSFETTTRNDELQNINHDTPDKNKIQKEVKENVSKEKFVPETIHEYVTKGSSNYEYKETLEEVNKIPVLATLDNEEANIHSLNNDRFENSESVTLDAKPDYDNSRNFIENENKVYFNINNGYTEIDSKNLISNETKIISEKHMDVQENKFKDIQSDMFEKNDINAVLEMSPNDSVKEQINYIDNENVKGEHDVQDPVENINVQEFKPNSSIKLHDDNFNINTEEYINHENVDSSYPNNPEQCINEEFIQSIPEHKTQADDVVENSVNPDITSGIEAFDAEQREMFYSEETQENYELDQSDVTNTYNQEYDANNENYQQHPEYYEGVQMEQAYPVEINEHEETLQRYDQNYEEQYSTYEQGEHEQQEYEDHQQYEQLPQHVQPEIDDIIQPEIDQSHYEQHNYETQGYVEEQLDREQGLIEKQVSDEITVDNLQIDENQVEQVVD